MNLPRSRFCTDTGCVENDPAVEAIRVIAGTCRGCGYRRVTAGLRNRGLVVNSRKARHVRTGGICRLTPADRIAPVLVAMFIS